MGTVVLAPPVVELPAIRNSVGTAPPGGGTVGINTAGCDVVVPLAVVPPDEGTMLIVIIDVGRVAEAVADGCGATPYTRGGASERSFGRGGLIRNSFGDDEFVGV